jgi:hypothetical protein
MPSLKEIDPIVTPFASGRMDVENLTTVSRNYFSKHIQQLPSQCLFSGFN